MVLFSLLALVATGASAKDPKPAPGLSPDARTHLGLAQTYLEQHQDARAMEHVRMAQRSDPDAAQVHVMFALLYSADGEQGKAGKSFARALKLAPTSGAVLNAHAAWLCEQGQVDQADAEFARAQRDPAYNTPLQALSNAGRCAHRAERWAKAEQYFRHALEFAPEDGQLLLLLADTELRQGQTLEARAFVQRRDALGADAATLELAARIEDAAGDRIAAARYRQRLREQFPDYVPTGEGATTP
jgi:type IV pilus assembly protein PilF